MFCYQTEGFKHTESRDGEGGGGEPYLNLLCPRNWAVQGVCFLFLRAWAPLRGKYGVSRAVVSCRFYFYRNDFLICQTTRDFVMIPFLGRSKNKRFAAS